MEAKIEGNVEKIDVSQIIATCSLTATRDDRVEGRYQGSYLTFRLISCRHPLPHPPVSRVPALPLFLLARSGGNVALDAKIASPRIIDYKLLVSLP